MNLTIEEALVTGLPIGPGQVAHCDCCNVCIRPGHRVEVLLTITGTHISPATTRCRSCARGELQPETTRSCLLVRGRANDANSESGRSQLVLSGAEVIDRTE